MLIMGTSRKRKIKFKGRLNENNYVKDQLQKSTSSLKELCKPLKNLSFYDAWFNISKNLQPHYHST